MRFASHLESSTTLAAAEITRLSTGQSAGTTGGGSASSVVLIAVVLGILVMLLAIPSAILLNRRKRTASNAAQGFAGQTGPSLSYPGQAYSPLYKWGAPPEEPPPWPWAKKTLPPRNDSLVAPAPGEPVAPMAAIYDQSTMSLPAAPAVSKTATHFEPSLPSRSGLPTPITPLISLPNRSIVPITPIISITPMRFDPSLPSRGGLPTPIAPLISLPNRSVAPITPIISITPMRVNPLTPVPDVPTNPTTPIPPLPPTAPVHTVIEQPSPGPSISTPDPSLQAIMRQAQVGLFVISRQHNDQGNPA